MVERAMQPFLVSGLDDPNESCRFPWRNGGSGERLEWYGMPWQKRNRMLISGVWNRTINRRQEIVKTFEKSVLFAPIWRREQNADDIGTIGLRILPNKVVVEEQKEKGGNLYEKWKRILSAILAVLLSGSMPGQQRQWTRRTGRRHPGTQQCWKDPVPEENLGSIRKGIIGEARLKGSAGSTSFCERIRRQRSIPGRPTALVLGITEFSKTKQEPILDTVQTKQSLHRCVQVLSQSWTMTD